MCEPYTAIGDPYYMLAPYSDPSDFEFDDSMAIDDSFAEIFNSFPGEDLLSGMQPHEDWSLMFMHFSNAPAHLLYPVYSGTSPFFSLSSPRKPESSPPMAPVPEPKTQYESDELDSRSLGVQPVVNINDSAELYEVTTTLPPPSALSDYSKGLDLSGVPEIKPGVDYSCIKKELDADESFVATGQHVPCMRGSLNHGCHQTRYPGSSLSEDYAKKEEWLTPAAYGGSVTRDDAPDGIPQDRTEEAILRNSESHPPASDAKADESERGNPELVPEAMSPHRVDHVSAVRSTIQDFGRLPATPCMTGRRRAALEGTKRVKMIAREEIEDNEDETEDGDEAEDWDEPEDGEEVLEHRASGSRKRNRGTRNTASRQTKKRKVDGHAKASSETTFKWNYSTLCAKDPEFLRYREAYPSVRNCDTCKGEGFNRKHDMMRHMVTLHTLKPENRPSCPKCRTVLCRQDALRRHELKCKGKKRKRRLTQLEMREIRESNTKSGGDSSTVSSSGVGYRRSQRQRTVKHKSARCDY